jgi:hypothetical protein
MRPLSSVSKNQLKQETSVKAGGKHETAVGFQRPPRRYIPEYYSSVKVLG